jgi:hypothetical protein
MCTVTIYCVQYVSFTAFLILCAVFCFSVVCYFVCCVLLYYRCHRVQTHLQSK